MRGADGAACGGPTRWQLLEYVVSQPSAVGCDPRKGHGQETHREGGVDYAQGPNYVADLGDPQTLRRYGRVGAVTVEAMNWLKSNSRGQSRSGGE